MKVLAQPAPFGSPPQPVCLAIGVFDGVHLGHQEVLRQTLADARIHGGVSVVATFDRHPSAVLAPDRVPPGIWPVWRRLDACAAMGFDAALVFTFDEAFSRQSAGEFLDRLAGGVVCLASISVGTTFVFGHRRSGTVETLREHGMRRGYGVHGIPPLEQDGEVVSSTRLREWIAAGDLGRAARALGRPVSLAGDVVEGDRLGRQLGFPTANLAVDGMVLPPTGVYAATAVTREGRWAAAVNLGRRPTVAPGGGAVRVEAHLIGFEGDLYGTRLELELDRRLRGEERFPSREALVAAIARDVADVTDWAGKRGLPAPRPLL